MTTINLDIQGEIATLTLNNPDKLNAINLAMWQQLSAHMATISADREIRCVILRGAGEQAFAAGGDLEEFVTSRATLANNWLTLSGSGTSATIASLDYAKFVAYAATNQALKTVVAFDAIAS